MAAGRAYSLFTFRLLRSVIPIPESIYNILVQVIG